MTTNTNSWSIIVNKINNVITGEPKTVEDIARQTGLDECTIRGFVVLANAKDVIQNNKTVYISCEPKRLSAARLVRLLLDVSDKLDGIKYLPVKKIYERLHKFNPTLKYDNVSAQIYQLHSKGVLGRKGFHGSYTFCLLDEPVKKSNVASKSMADQLIAIAEYVEKSEAKQTELEKENIRLNKELSTLKNKVKNLLGDES